MGKTLTTEDFIFQAKAVHGDKYDYSRTTYVDFKTKVCIVCPKHGEFWQIPSSHTKGGCGCPKCGVESRSRKRKLDTESVIKRAKAVHNNKYDYSLLSYNSQEDKVKIICPVHGVFEQKLSNHLQGQGCPVCAGTIKKTTEQFIIEARTIHGDKYDYSLVEYKGNKSKVIISCPIHGLFAQAPISHLTSCGCPMCAHENAKKSRFCSKEHFVRKARAIHGDKYDYSKVQYINSYTPVTIICPIHGEFERLPMRHIEAHAGCPQCLSRLSWKKNRHYKVGVVDVDDCEEDAKKCWHRMVRRCYDDKFHESNTTYFDCEVCEEWLIFSNFASWFKEHYVEGWQLDKDILVDGNRIYSPRTCCFVPQEINSIFTSRVKDETKKLKAPLLAEKYKDRLEERVYKRLCNI
jgi:hypothetical protein